MLRPSTLDGLHTQCERDMKMIRQTRIIDGHGQVYATWYETPISAVFVSYEYGRTVVTFDVFGLAFRSFVLSEHYTIDRTRDLGCLFIPFIVLVCPFLILLWRLLMG